jgi:hypothetical protein
VLSEYGKDDSAAVFISPQEFRIVIRADIPSTNVKLQGEAAGSNSQFGIAPMHLTQVGCDQTIVIGPTSGSGKLNQDVFEYVLLRENVSAALWGVKPGPASAPVKNQIVGMEIRIKPLDLSKSFSTYSIKDLAELILREGKGWGISDASAAKPEKVEYMKDNPDKKVLQKQSQLLQAVFPHLSAPRYVKDGIYDTPMNYLWATPQTRKTGEKYNG